MYREDWMLDVVETMYRDGMSSNEIAAELDVPQSTILYWLAGRTRTVQEGRHLRGGQWGVLRGAEGDLLAALRAGRSAGATARQLGVSPSAITYHWERMS